LSQYDSPVTELITVDPASPDPGAIARAAERLRAGGLVAFPTETVYGLGVHALDRDAVRRLFEAKGRPATDPLIVHVASIADLAPLVLGVPPEARRLAARFWPGPLTLVLPRSPIVPDEVTAGLDTVAVRIPAHPVARALLDAVGLPIAAPSANLFSRPSPTLAIHVLDDLDGRINIIIDAGPTTVGLESTVLDLSGAIPTILRPGAVTAEMLRLVLRQVEVRADTRDGVSAMPSPGLLSKHYSPRAPLTLYEGEAAAIAARMTADMHSAMADGRVVGVIAADEDALGGHEGPPLRVIRIGPSHELHVVASRLYAALRELDGAGVDVILARQFPTDSGLGLAVQDRLRRAAAGRIVRC
jgi:L-threonylcarbamoyladenylate synthase